jgi:hypothetical protein
MKCLCVKGIYLIICLSLAHSALAQTAKPFSKFFAPGTWKITVIAGVSGQQPMGSLVKNFKDDIKAADENSGPDQKVSGKVLPVISYVAGIRLRKTFTDKLAAEAGFQLTRRGYHLRRTENSSDPDYQLDEQSVQHLKVRATILEIPVAGIYSFSAKDQLELAVHLGIGIRQSTRATLSYRKTVTINGSEDGEWSIPPQTTHPNYTSYLKAITPGIAAFYYRNLYKDLFAGIGFQYATQYFTTPDGKAGGLCALLHVKYTIDPSQF